MATSGGFAAAFTHTGDIITITLDQTYTTGQMVTVEERGAALPSGATRIDGQVFTPIR